MTIQPERPRWTQCFIPHGYVLLQQAIWAAYEQLCGIPDLEDIDPKEAPYSRYAFDTGMDELASLFRVEMIAGSIASFVHCHLGTGDHFELPPAIWTRQGIEADLRPIIDLESGAVNPTTMTFPVFAGGELVFLQGRPLLLQREAADLIGRLKQAHEQGLRKMISSATEQLSRVEHAENPQAPIPVSAPETEQIAERAAAETRRKPGRPSVMDLIVAEFRRRLDQRIVEPKLKHEADALEAWAKKEIMDCSTPRSQSIENKIRLQHADYRSNNFPTK